MLVDLGRSQEAFDYGLTYLGTTQEAYTLAKALAEHGEREQSLTMAEHGLSLEGQKAPLAKWLREQAEIMGKADLALRAAEIAYREEISLENYLRIAAIAGEQWTERRTALLEYTRYKKIILQQGQVEVFLHEGLLDDAIASLEPYAGHIQGGAGRQCSSGITITFRVGNPGQPQTGRADYRGWEGRILSIGSELACESSSSLSGIRDAKRNGKRT